MIMMKVMIMKEMQMIIKVVMMIMKGEYDYEGEVAFITDPCCLFLLTMYISSTLSLCIVGATISTNMCTLAHVRI